MARLKVLEATSRMWTINAALPSWWALVEKKKAVSALYWFHLKDTDQLVMNAVCLWSLPASPTRVVCLLCSPSQSLYITLLVRWW